MKLSYRARARHRARDLDRVLVRVRYLLLIRVRDLDLVGAHRRDRDIARDLARELASAHDRVHDLDHELDREVDLILTRTRDVDRVRPEEPDLARVHDLVHGLDHARDRLSLLTDALDQGLELGMDRCPVSPSARWLAEAATRLLPETERPRYSEEWQSELWEIAGTSHREQIALALHIVIRAWPTRWEVLRGQRRTAGGG